MSNKKRVMSVLQYLKENTNEEHPAKSEQIIAYLEQQGFEVERKTIYNDIKELNEMDFTIEKSHNGYYFASDCFELSELRFLVDCVKSSDVLPLKKSSEICEKLLSLTNSYDRKLVDNGEYHSNKSVNQQILYNIDEIIRAIEEKRSITFRYFDITPDNNKNYRSKNYNVFPYSLVINDDRYYLICANVKYPDDPSSYRLDKIEEVKRTNKIYERIPFDINAYMDGLFSMYNGADKNIVLRCDNRIYSEVKQKFGDLLIVTQKEKDWFECNVKAAISPTFFSWVFTFNGKITILSPSDVKEEMIHLCQQLIEKHK